MKFTGTQNEYLLPEMSSLHNQNQDLLLLELISTDPHILLVCACLMRLGGDACNKDGVLDFSDANNPVLFAHEDDAGRPSSKRDFLSITNINYHVIFLTQEAQST